MYRSLIPYLATFLDRGLAGWRAQNWASIVLCPANSTQSCAIYKLTSGLAGWLAQHCTSIVLCPPNNIQKFRDIQIDRRTPGLAGSRLNMYYTLHVICIAGYRAGGLKISTFWIAGSRAGGLKIGPLLFCVLQTTPRVARYTN
jgi:hypothetical protein